MPSTLDRRRFVAGAAAVAAGGLLPADAAAARGPRRERLRSADLLVVNGRVLTLDRGFRVHEAVAVRDGVVLATGRTRDLRRLATRRTRIVDARGGTVMPGINDSHLHFSAFGLAMPPTTAAVDTATIPELQAAVRAAAEAAGPGGAWVRGSGWNENRIGRAPTRQELDAVSGEHPVILSSFDYHAVAVNTRALQLAGVTRDTVAPPGAVIEKDAAGEPTGVLREGAAGLVRAVVPPFTREETQRGVLAGLDALHALGITSLTDPGIDEATVALLRRMSRAGRLPVRLNVLLSAGSSLATARAALDAHRPVRGADERLFRVAGMKVFADGIPTAARTAWLSKPYLDGSNGALTVAGASPAEQVATLEAIIALAHRRGLQIGTHATGDAAIDAVVGAYVKAMRAHRRRDPRHYVIHADLTPQATLRRMARHDIGANMNASVKTLLGRTLDGVIGPERTDYQWPYRSALDAGVRVSSASDAPVTPPDWRQGIEGAVLRRGQFGGVAGEAERITLREAIRTYTSTPAWQDRAEGWKGRLVPGHVADVVVLGDDVLAARPDRITDIDVTTTIVAGAVVHERRGSARADAARTRLARASGQAHARACLEAGGCCCTLSKEIVAGRV
ncbi:amidohydrolase [Patulibacter sp. SYSU D01012]|uniref:amidohydrolase n=1 Tax=Patulibacter sp. SYSU D01012 TaxID=2817381 RepID=UPI001B30F733|nr:amidohydrolase [Patulibacter sp. SYSU D01012]